MDIDTFEDIVSQDRYETLMKSEGFLSLNCQEREYKGYTECPRCHEWKLAARTTLEKQRGTDVIFGVSEKKWRITERWWECKNCESRFDVSGDVNEVQRCEVRPLHRKSKFSEIDLLMYDGKIGRVKKNTVSIPSKSKTFKIPPDHNIPDYTTVKLEKDEDAEMMWCTVID